MTINLESSVAKANVFIGFVKTGRIYNSVVVDKATNKPWANESFRTIGEAMDFIIQNELLFDACHLYNFNWKIAND